MPEFTNEQLRYHVAKGGFPANALAEELLRVREELASLDTRYTEAVKVFSALRAKHDRLRAQVEWNKRDMSYKAPEQLRDVQFVLGRYMSPIEKMLAEEESDG